MGTLLNEAASQNTLSKSNSAFSDSDESDSNFNSIRNIAMQKNNTSDQASTNPTTFDDLQSLRLPANYGATLGVKKVLMKAHIGKPQKNQFMRTHASNEMTFPAMILENPQPREFYAVVPAVAQEIGQLVRPALLHAAIDRQNNIFLIPVYLPDDSGRRHSAHESLAQAVELARTKWIRITWNTYTSGYDVYEAESKLPEPEWPAHDIDELVQVAFRGKIILDLDHPVLQSLLGRI